MTQQVIAEINALLTHNHALECSGTHITDDIRSVINDNKGTIETLRNILPYAVDCFDAEALLERHLADVGHNLEDCREAIKTLRDKSPTQFFEIETLRERLLDQNYNERRIKRNRRGAPELTPAQQRTLNAIGEEARQDIRDAAELAALGRNE